MSRITGLDLDYNYKLSNPANNGDTDTGNGNYFKNNEVGAGAHYFVDEDRCTQSVSDNYIAFHCQTPGMPLKCGCRNNNSIGIEMCSDKVNGKYVITKQTKSNAVILTKWLMKKYNVPVSRVIRHFDVCGKNCPEPWVRVESEWKDFKNRLEDDNMTEADVRKIAEQVANDLIYRYVTSKEEDVYNNINEVPYWGKNTVKKLIDKGILKGTDKGLDLRDSLLRQLVINDRAGLYD